MNINPNNPVTWHDPPQSLEDHINIAMYRNMDFATDDVRPYRLGTYVQLGAGHKLIAGAWDNLVAGAWDNLDYPAWDAETMPLPYKDESVDGICSYHTLDHISPERVIVLLGEIQRVLKEGGWFINVVPHYMSELWNTDLTHKSKFGVDTWRNVFSTRHYDHAAVKGHTKWKLRIDFNMIMGFTERNLVLVTKLVKDEWAGD